MEYVKLGEVIELISGRDLSKKEYNADEVGIPYIMGASNINNRNLQIERWTDNPSVIGLKDDIVISVKGTIGKLLILKEEKVHLSRQVMAIRVKNYIDKKFMFYHLKYSINKFEEKAKGLIPGITREDILQSDFIYVNIDQQRKIIILLDKAQELIDKRKEQIAACDELVKCLFYHMFGDVYHNNRNWNKNRLEKFINIVGGYAFKSDKFKNEGIPVLRIGNINSGYFKSVNMVYWEDESRFERYLIFPGDLVISLTGTVGKDDYGNVCIIGAEYNKYYLNQRNAKFEIKENLNKHYLMHVLKVPDIKKKLTGISRGIRQANISNRDILNLELPVPPIDLQNDFAKKVEKIEQQKQLLTQSLTELENNFNSLMQRAFKGELF